MMFRSEQMLNTITLTRPFTAAAAICAGIALSLAPARADDAAEAFVQTVLDDAEPLLDIADTDQDAFFKGIEELVDKYVDMRRVSLFTLGQYARQISDEQKAAYLPLFDQYATQIYQNTLADYAGQKLEVVQSVDRSDRDIIVNSKISDPAPGDPLTDTIFHWRIYRNRDGELSIVDAGADNVWLAIEQRSQFTSVIANNGGGEQGMEALLAQLREQVGE